MDLRGPFDILSVAVSSLCPLEANSDPCLACPYQAKFPSMLPFPPICCSMIPDTSVFWAESNIDSWLTRVALDSFVILEGYNSCEL